MESDKGKKRYVWIFQREHPGEDGAAITIYDNKEAAYRNCADQIIKSMAASASCRVFEDMEKLLVKMRKLHAKGRHAEVFYLYEDVCAHDADPLEPWMSVWREVVRSQ